MSNTTTRLATIACTIIVSATMLLGALAPATSIGATSIGSSIDTAPTHTVRIA